MDDATPPVAGDDTAAIDGLLLESLKALAAAGEVEMACQLAGRACALYRRDNPRAWNRFNVLLHRLAARASGPQQGPRPAG